MSLFSPKNLITELKVGLLEKNKVFVSINNIPNENNFEIQSYIVYMFFLDKILVNLPEKLSVTTLKAIHSWGTQFLDKLYKIESEEVWETTRLELKTPNAWTFTNNEEDFAQASFVATAKIFSKNNKIFCETYFSRDKYIEVKAYLLVESLLSYITQNSSLYDYSYNFLPALLAQCFSYNNKRPGITQLGQAVYYGLKQAQLLRDKQGYNFWFNYGLDFGKLEKYDEEIKCYNDALRINPQFAKALVNKGIALNRLEKYYEAIKCFDDALRINPQDAIACNNKGVSLGALGKYYEEIQCYNDALRINQQYADALYNKGVALGALGKYDEAVECFDDAISINPQYTDAWVNKGVALYTLRKYNESIKCYDEAIRINSQDAITWYNKGLVLRLLGNINEAYKCFAEAKSIDPKLGEN